MTTGEQGRSVPDAEHYLDLPDVEDAGPGPHFDVVLRGYDRRQVDEHVAGLRRMVAQLRAQLAVRERRRGGDTDSPQHVDSPPHVDSPQHADRATPAPSIPQARVPGVTDMEASTAALTPTEGSHGTGGDEADTYAAFNDRLRGILQAAEQEAQLVRSKAAETLLAEHAESRAALADLRSQRDSVVEELVRLRGWLDEIVSHPGRAPSAPPPVLSPGPPRGAGSWPPPGARGRGAPHVPLRSSGPSGPARPGYGPPSEHAYPAAAPPGAGPGGHGGDAEPPATGTSGPDEAAGRSRGSDDEPGTHGRA